MNPLFSVIITTYNRGPLLLRAIHSVLQQHFTDFELIIVDDHSSDNTPQILATLADKRIKLIRQTENKGVSAARNTGISYTKGEYICFLDDDDELCTAYLAEINKFLKKKSHPFIGLIWSGIAKIYTANNLAKKKETTETQLFNLDSRLLFLDQTPFSGITIHRLCFERAGVFNTMLQVAEDIDLELRMLAAKADYAAIPKILVKIHIHEQTSLSRSIRMPNRIKNLERFLLNHDKFLSQHLSLWLRWQTNLVGDYYHTGKKQQARKLIRRIGKKKWYYLRIWELFLRFELLKPLKFALQKFFS